jgi:ketopantoate reductase
MDTRLVVGCGSIGHALVTTLSGESGRLRVLGESERRIEQVRDRGLHLRGRVLVAHVVHVGEDWPGVYQIGGVAGVSLTAGRVVSVGSYRSDWAAIPPNP